MQWLAQIGPSTQVALLALLVSLLSLGATWVRDARARQRERFDLRQAYFLQIEKWAVEVLDVMSEATFACDFEAPQILPEDFFRLRHDLRWRLSSLLDRGRWYFPNLQVDEFGMEKPLAYQGYRQKVLDCIANTGRVVANLSYQPNTDNTSYKQQLIQQKREFTSEIQRILDPRERSHEFQRLTNP